jgi:hypothetical protein
MNEEAIACTGLQSQRRKIKNVFINLMAACAFTLTWKT